jgi:DNA topoisomerase I
MSKPAARAPRPRPRPRPPEKTPSQDPAEAARAAGLTYVRDDAPGITRKGAGKGFSYVDAAGKPVKDKDELGRIKRLGIPPAWTKVWICPSARGHIQATGRDARGRKQYRYHARWREVRDETKYHKMIAFAHALPALRDKVDRDLGLPGLPREKVLATVVRLLETTLIRVGNDEYARDNDSYGLTTLRDGHAKIDGARIRFRFRGKSGKEHEVGLRDRRLARIVKRCQDLEGDELFQYVDEGGETHRVSSGDVNEYLRAASGEEFTAKDFRTWAGTVLAAMALSELEAFDSEAEAKRNVVQAVEAVARRLGNTRAVCRRCYVHPEVVDAYLDGGMVDVMKRRAEVELRGALSKLPPEEAAVLALLQQRLARAQKPLVDTLRASVRVARTARRPGTREATARRGRAARPAAARGGAAAKATDARAAARRR